MKEYLGPISKSITTSGLGSMSDLTNCFSLSCTHNKEPGVPTKTWWKLDFPTEVQIDWIHVWNRLDSGGKHQHRIDKVEVRQGDLDHNYYK